jgi:hypothetical protein
MISPSILSSVVEHLEDDGYKFFNIYQIDNYITGIFLDKTVNFLNVTKEPSPTLNSQVNNNVIFNFFEVGIVLRNIYLNKDYDFYKMLIHNSDLEVSLNNNRIDIINLFNKQISLYYFSDWLINKIDNDILKAKNYNIDIYNEVFEDYSIITNKDFFPEVAHSLNDFLLLNKQLLDIKFELGNKSINTHPKVLGEDLDEYITKMRLKEV